MTVAVALVLFVAGLGCGSVIGFLFGYDARNQEQLDRVKHAREAAARYRSEYFRLWEQMHERNGVHLK